MATNEILFQAGAGKRLFADEFRYDLFVSAFNLSERVNITFERVVYAAAFDFLNALSENQGCWFGGFYLYRAFSIYS